MRHIIRMIACTIIFIMTLPNMASETNHSTLETNNQNVSQALGRFIAATNEYDIHIESVSIIQHGQFVASWKDAEDTVPQLWNQNEISGTVTAIAVGLAVDEGLINMDDKVAGFFPELLPAKPSANLLAMTVRHLLTMTSGHDRETPYNKYENWAEAYLTQPVAYTPGSYFFYDPMAGYMMSAILQKVTGVSMADYLRPRLFEPLGITNIEWEASPQGICAGGWGLHISTRDMALIGSLLVQKGKWEYRRILSRKWVKQMICYQTTSCPRDVRYENLPQSGLSLSSNDWIQGFGYQMWQCRSGLVRAEGTGGQILLLFPEFEAIVMINADTKQMESELALAYLHLGPSIPDWKGKKEKRSRTQTRQHNLHYVNSHL